MKWNNANYQHGIRGRSHYDPSHIQIMKYDG
jgi:hypothetical protein